MRFSPDNKNIVSVIFWDIQKGEITQTLDIARLSDIALSADGTYFSQNRVVRWDGRNDKGESVASGTYFYELRAGKICQIRRMTVIK